MAWTGVTLVYAGYLAALAWLVPRFAPARPVALASAVLSALLWWLWPSVDALPPTQAAITWVVVPSLTLLGTYRVSGAFFVRPSLALEQALLRVDEALLRRSGVLAAYRAAGRPVQEAVELLYAFVYVVVPLGAAVLAAAGLDQTLAGYWRTVFVAELACYAALPWLQSRPPRMLDAPVEHQVPGAIRRVNDFLLRHGSIQVNTVPSAHAAGAAAVALAVFSAAPIAGVAFLAVAAGITVATVLGRYHYAVDSIMGLALAVAAWALVGS